MTKVCSPEHKHGLTGTCYQRHYCRCQPCKDHRAKQERGRAARARTGHLQEYVPTIRVVAHIMHLTREGWTYADIEAVSGVSVPSISRIVRGITERVERETFDAILGTDPAMRDRAPEPRKLDPTGTVRRLHALVAMGWTFWELSKRAGHAKTWALNVTHSNTVTRKTRDTVTALYDELWDKEPPRATPTERVSYTRSRLLAERNGWVGPLHWDDIDNDDGPVTTATTPTTKEWVVSELEHLKAAGESPTAALTALGRRREATVKLAVRYGRPDLGRWLEEAA